MSDTSPAAAAPAPNEADLSGRKLGDFRLLLRLGRGAMAEVYLAEQERLKRRVAIKILKPELAGDRVYLQRFELEAQAAASLVHANIVQIYEVGCVEGFHYIAQEYVQGKNLRDYLGRHGPPDLPHALSIMRQAAAALAKAAEQGVVHRDIKPENIMLTAGGEVKVADFGLARITREGAAQDLTQIGITLGTPLYMSPEQVEGKPLDPRSDIYSLGVTCYQMLGGVTPFAGETALGVAVQHLKSRPRPLESLRPDLPASLCRIVHRMLAKDPAQRFDSARSLLRELRRVQVEQFGDDWPEDLPGWESLAAELPPDPRVAATRRLDELMKSAARLRAVRHRRGWFAAGLVIALLAGAVGAWYFSTPTPLLARTEAVASAIPPKQSSVWRQWYLAAQIGTEAAWRGVVVHFSENKYVALRAKQQIAMIYLREERFDEAMATFDELAGLGDDQPELRAFGLAGQCGVLSLRGEWRASDAVLNRLWPLRDKLSGTMQAFVEYAIRRNRDKIGNLTTPEWEKWLNEQLHQDKPAIQDVAVPP